MPKCPTCGNEQGRQQRSVQFPTRDTCRSCQNKMPKLISKLNLVQNKLQQWTSLISKTNL